MENETEMISLDADDIKRRIFTVRGKQVMLDRDLAEYFGTTTGNLNRAMKRNIKRFPDKFCFQITADECSRLQIGILKKGRGSNIKYLPYVYTEQGIANWTCGMYGMCVTNCNPRDWEDYDAIVQKKTTLKNN